MKKTSVLLTGLIVICSTLPGLAQVAINTTGDSPDPSAILDISSSDKGMLLPRVTLISLADTLNPIPQPAKGLMIYNVNSTLDEGFYTWDGSKWSALASMDAVRSTIDVIGDPVIGEIYEFHEAGSFTVISLTNDGAWHGWHTGVTGDTLSTFTSLNGDFKRMNISEEGYYRVSFHSAQSSQSGGVTFDAAVFLNDHAQDDLRTRATISSSNQDLSISLSGIVKLMPGDYLDIRFSAGENKNLRLSAANLCIHRLN